VKFEARTGDISEVKCDAVIVNLFSGTGKPGDAVAAIDRKLAGLVGGLIKSGEIKGKLSELHVIHTLGKLPAGLVVIAGAGKQKEFNLDKLRNVMAESVRALKKHNCKTAATLIPGDGAGGLAPDDCAQAIIEGSLLGAYQYTRHRTKEDDERDIELLLLVEQDRSKIKQLEEGIERGRIVAGAVNLARDMVNEPANHMAPVHMAKIAGEVAAANGLKLTVLGREQMEKQKMGALLGVAQGTSQPPKFIVLSYRGDPTKKETLGFIGKGLTFDSGGISLKPQEFMSDMKGDMAGGAAVIAAIGAVAQLKLKINITAIVPATENLPGGRALKPGDVLKASNGKTIEVVNTDAEGRLILADALCYAVRQGISPLIDLATLTGACHIALGDSYAGLFTNNQALVDKVVKAGNDCGENLWQLPLPDEYKESNKSDIADIKNSGGRYGGAITAALFLQEFVAETPWVHMDIAGPFMTDKTKGLLVKGATGFGVRTLIKLAVDLSRKKGGR
jgi:leucyl aminopeptidase